MLCSELKLTGKERIAWLSDFSLGFHLRNNDKSEIFDSKRHSRQDSEEKSIFSKTSKALQIFKKTEIDWVKDMIKDIVISKFSPEINPQQTEEKPMVTNFDSKLDEIDNFNNCVIELDEINLSIDSKVIVNEDKKIVDDIIWIFQKSVNAKVHK